MILLTATLTLFSVLRSPVFQKLAGQIATNLLSHKLNMEITMESLRISDFLFLEIHNLKVRDNHHRDMLSINDLQVKVRHISLSDHVLGFDRVNIDSGGFFLSKYPGDSLTNLDFLIRALGTDTTAVEDTLPPAEWKIFCDGLTIDRFSFGLINEFQPDSTPGIDFNYLRLDDIFVDMKDIAVIGDSVAAFVDHVSCRERSGLELLNFSGDAQVSRTGIRVKGAQVSTGQTSLDLDLKFLYDGYDKLSYFLDSVRMDASIRSSLVTLSDVGYFAPELLVMDDPVMISGTVTGPVSDFAANGFSVSFGEFTEFEGDIIMRGLPDFDSTFAAIDINHFTTSVEDIEEFNLPLADPNLKLPEQLKPLGIISVEGNYKGYPGQFSAMLNVVTDAGSVSFNGSLSRSNISEEILLAADIQASGLDLGSLFNSAELGMVNLEMELNGRGTEPDSMDMDINGWIEDLEFRDYQYEKIVIGGHISGLSYDGRVLIMDPALKLDFSGLVDLNQENPAFDFKVDIEKALLYRLNLASRSNDMNITGKISGDFKGINTESFNGEIIIDDLKYTENKETFGMNHLELSRTRNPGKPDVIRLRSDYVDGEMEGTVVLRELISQVTTFILAKKDDDAIKEEFGRNPQQVSFNLLIKDISDITGLFMPGIEISPGTRISGKFDSEKLLLELEGAINKIMISGISFDEVNFSGRSADREFFLDLGVSNISLSENEGETALGLDNFKSRFNSGDDSIRYEIEWDNLKTDHPNNGHIDGFLRFGAIDRIEASIFNAEANLNGSKWQMAHDNYFRYDSTGIEIRNLDVYKNDENFIVDGKLSNHVDDTLSLYFKNWSLANFNPLTESYSLILDGIIDGRFGIFRNDTVPNIFANLNIADLSLNNVLFGNAGIRTHWLESDRALSVDVNILSDAAKENPFKILGVNGLYYPFDNRRNFDFDIAVQNLNISVLEPMLSSFSSHLAGYASGRLNLDGTNDKPLLTGRLKLQRAEMQVDYLNVIYSFSNEVVFSENQIQFNELTVYDPQSNTAILNGGIRHTYFQDMHLDLTIKPENFMAMNLDRYQNEVFYGKAFATGNVRLSGPFTHLSIEVDVRTDEGTSVFIPINYSVDVSENDFIIFTSAGDTVIVHDTAQVQVEGVSLDIGLNVNRNADIEIFLPGNIGSIKATGDGTLRLGVDPNGYLTLNGSYVIQSGLFSFTLEQLVSRRFDILEGSKISWTGDINDAEVNIVARYRLRTDLSGLGITMIDPEASSQKVIVFTDIRMMGNLFNPDLSFGISFPNMQEQVKQSVYAVLDTNDMGLMNQQAISLLVLGSFSSTGTGGTNPVNAAAIMSSTLSNMLSQISNDFNIGINYIPGDRVSNEQLEVALSTQLLDDRLIIDGNIDVSSNSSSTQKTSSIVGDINVEYKLTPDGRFRVKAFNRSNDLSLFEDESPYTQGVGIFYRKEFDNIGELFRKSKVHAGKKTNK